MFPRTTNYDIEGNVSSASRKICYGSNVTYTSSSVFVRQDPDHSIIQDKFGSRYSLFDNGFSAAFGPVDVV